MRFWALSPSIMNRTATLLVALVVASAAVAPAAAVQTDTATSTAQAANETATGTTTTTAPTENGTADENDTETVAAGARLSGAIGVQEAEIDGEVESRTFGIKVAKANTDDAKAQVVGEQLNTSEARLTELQERLESLEDARENGSIDHGQYAARAAKLQTEVNTVRRMGTETATVSETLPRETLEANGVNVTAIETLRQNAANLTGPEVAAVAKTIAGPGAGQGQPPDRAGGADDRADDNGAPDDRTDGTETDTTDDGSDDYSGDGGDDGRQSGEQGR